MRRLAVVLLAGLVAMMLVGAPVPAFADLLLPEEWDEGVVVDDNPVDAEEPDNNDGIRDGEVLADDGGFYVPVLPIAAGVATVSCAAAVGVILLRRRPA